MFKIPKMMISLMASLVTISAASVTYMETDTTYQRYNDVLNESTIDYTRAGYIVPKVDIVYVESLGSNILARYISGMMYLAKSDDDALLERVIRHELAHAITGKLIEEDPEGLAAYRVDRIDGYEQSEILEGLTPEELDYEIRLSVWYAYTLTVEEIIAEDLYYSVYRQPTMQIDTLGFPTKQQMKNLKELITLSNQSQNDFVDEELLN